jgi:hypothetical protein
MLLSSNLEHTCKSATGRSRYPVALRFGNHVERAFIPTLDVKGAAAAIGIKAHLFQAGRGQLEGVPVGMLSSLT